MIRRGSEWTKWDLHVHTPASLVHNYPGPEPWEAFLADLEGLPEEVKVIGINDYLFLDGYSRVVEEKARGRLSNISLVLPVIELRIPQFGGTRSHWSRVNLHAIFDPALTAKQIEDYFLASLVRHYQLSHEAVGQGLEWRSHPTRESLESLGQSIIDSAPPEERSRYGPPIIEGFNNLNVTREAVVEALGHSMLKGRALVAVGKTEWADIKWSDGSIAEKKNTINQADFVFISAARPSDALAARQALAASNVNSRLLDCSDAHSLSTSAEKDRLGKCATWIKGDLTFRALRYARIEYENRVYIGDRPPIFSRIYKAPGKFIDRVRISPNALCPPDKRWFETEINLNPEMVCLVGNKGSGKSALLDIIGLAGNSRNHEHFSFLRHDRFRKKPQNPARWFDVELHWRDGRVTSRQLSADVDDSVDEEVRYLPQSYLEGICNEISSDSEGRLDRELKRIIFECLPNEKKLGRESLEELIVELSQEYQGRLDAARSKVSGINQRIIDLEPLELPSTKERIGTAISSLQERIEQHDASRPPEVPSPDDSKIGEQLRAVALKLESCNDSTRNVEEEIERAKVEAASLEKRLISLRRIHARMQDIVTAVRQAEVDLSKLVADAGVSLDVSQILDFRFDVAPVNEHIVAAASRKGVVEELLDPKVEGGPAHKLAALKREAESLAAQMSEPMRLHLLYQEQMAAWEKSRAELVGNETSEGSLVWLQSQLARIASAGELLSGLYEERRREVSSLAQILLDLKEGLRGLYGAAQRSLESAAVSGVPIEFDVHLEARGFIGRFLEFVHLGVRSGYQGHEHALKTLEDLLGDIDLNNAESIADFVEAALGRLRRADGDRVSVASVLKGGWKVSEVYDWVSQLSFLAPVFRLLFDGKSISLLSPGQRGMVLLLFYLLIDPEDIPLLVDQPEENLDNETVSSYLTSAFRSARARRQVIVVTHNANLAVVCDADQIVMCNRRDEVFGYEARPLEEVAAVEVLMNVLEGTREAFDVRGSKYAS